MGFSVKLINTPTFLMLEIILERGLREHPLVRWARTPASGNHVMKFDISLKRLMYDFKVSPFFCFMFPRCANRTVDLLVAWKCWRNDVLNCCQLEIDPAGTTLSHFLASLIRVTAKTLHLAISETKWSFIRSLKWSRWSWGSDFPSYALMARSLNPSSSLALHISRLKGYPVVDAINSTSFSFMTSIAWRRSSIRISPCLLGSTSGHFL